MSSNKLIWPCSSLSGLCDRLLDLHLVAAMARLENRELVLDWKLQSGFTEHQLKTWNSARFEDYKKENFTQYFNLPQNVRLVESIHKEPRTSQDSIFPEYIGGCHSPKTFNSRFCGQYSLEQFNEAFNEVTGEFTPTEKLLNLVSNINIPEIGVHLRRGDKITATPDPVQLHSNDLNDLNLMTENCLEKLITSNTPVFVCSDTKESKDNLVNKFKSKCNFIEFNSTHPFEQTYIDIYLLSKCKTIIMSQKHSNFSLFCSLLNKAKLIYFYKNNEMFQRASFSHVELYSKS